MIRRQRYRLLAIAAMAAVAAIPNLARAVTSTWTNGTNNILWTDPGNWTNGVPGAADSAIVNGNASIWLGNADRSVSLLNVTGSVAIQGGTLVTPYVETLSPASGAILSVNLQGTAAGIQLLSPYVQPFRLVGSLDVPSGVLDAYGVIFDDQVHLDGVGRFAASSLSGTITGTGSLDLRSGSLSVGSAAGASTAQLPVAMPITLGGAGSSFVYGGNAAQSVVTSVGTIDVDAGLGTIEVSAPSTSISTVLQPASIDVHPDGFLSIRLENGGRLVPATAPHLVGGQTGTTSAPIVPLTMFTTFGTGNTRVADDFATYDATPAPGGAGGIVGFRALRADEIQSGFAGATATTNVSVAAQASPIVPGIDAVNSLTLGVGTSLDLGTHDLTISSGGIRQFGDAVFSQPAGTISGSGGHLRSAEPIFIIAGPPTTGSTYAVAGLDIDVPIDAPALSVNGVGGTTGFGGVRLLRANSLPGGLSVSNAIVTVAVPGAIGDGPISIAQYGGVDFETDQTINGDVHLRTQERTSVGSQFWASRFDVAAGHTVDINGRLIGDGGFANSKSGTIHLNGGGTFGGYISSAGHVDIFGDWTLPPDETSLRGNGDIAGTANIPMDFEYGQISPGIRGGVGSMQIASLGTINRFASQRAITIAIDVDGDQADQLVVTAPLPTTGFGFVNQSTFSLLLNVDNAPALGSIFTIIDDHGTSPAIYPFTGIPEGGTVTANGSTFRVSYVGGDGNDITLTTVPEPGSLAALALLAAIGGSRRGRST